MKEMRRNMRIVGIIVLVAILATIVYFGYTVYIYGNRWSSNSYNPRLVSLKDNVNPGDIFDRNGVLLATMDAEGNRVYNSSESVRRAVSQTVGDTMGMSGTGVETFHAATLLGLSSSILDRITQQINGTQRKGSDMYLTIDAELSKYIADRFPEGKNGAVAVMNYKTGQLLAMVSLPSYDPEEVSHRSDEDKEAPYLNRVTQGQYVPGSIFKLVTLSAALDDIDDALSRHFDCTGSMVVEDGTVTDNEGNGHGDVTLESAFTRSCNLTFAQLALELGADKMERKATALGFNTNFLFQDLVVYSSSYPTPESDYELAWSGVGQGNVLVTPLHMAMLAGAVANGGQMMEPRLILRVSGDAGISQVLGNLTGGVYKRAFSASTAELLKRYMLETVKSGTGKRAAVDGVSIAGKTGTAEVSSSKAYKPHAWFIGFIDEVEHPLAIALVVENGGSGGEVASPLAGKIFEYAIDRGY